MIDHSLLKPQSTREELKKLCAEAVAHGFKAACVNPVHVADAAALLNGEAPIVCSVVGFPFGTHTPAAEVIRLGAREMDMILRVDALAMIEAGASRIGASTSVAILSQLDEK